MASYTDELIQFNPYVSQIPVESYVNTGFALQQRYDQNLQQIQGMVASVEGLPVVGEANIAYLKNLTSQLKSRLQEGLGKADLSKGTFVSQARGLATKAAKDPTVQAAIISAQKIKQLEDHAAQLRKEKPESFSEANYQRAMSYVQNYLQASKETPGLTYGSQGEPTNILTVTETQVKKRMFDIVKELDPNAEVSINDNGQIYFKSQVKELTPERIKTVIQGQLTADEYKALDNAAWYNFQGADAGYIAATTGTYFDEGYKHYKSLAEANKKYAEETTGLTPTQKSKYLEQAKYYENYAKQYENRRDNIINGYKSGQFDPQEAASSFWINRTLDGFGAMSFRQESEGTYDVSPSIKLAKDLAEIEKLKAEALKKKKEGEEEGGITPTGQNIVIPIDDSRFEDKKSNEIVTEEIDRRDKGVTDAWLKAIGDVFSTTTASGSVIPDDDIYDQYGNIKKDKMEEGAQVLAKTDSNYRKAALAEPPAMDENGKPIEEVPPIEGFSEKHLKNLRDVNTQVLSRNDLERQDKELDKAARESLRAQGKLVEDNSTIVVGGKTYTATEAERFFRQNTKLTTSTDSRSIGRGMGTISISNDKGLLQTRETIPGSTLSKLPESEEKKLREFVGKRNRNLTEIEDEKNKLWKERSSVNQPFMTYAVTSDKDAKLSNNNTLKVAVTENLDKAFYVGQSGNVFKDLGGKIDPEKTMIKGAYWNRGKLFMRAAVTIGSGEKEETKTIDVDITQVRSSYPNNKDWFDVTFRSDTHPHLTEALSSIGSKGKTPLDPKDNFANSLMVVGNNNIARYYGIERTSNGKFVVRLAIPTGGKSFSTRSFLPNAQGEIFEFNNAGEAIQAVDLFYKQPNIFNIERNILGNGK